MKCQICGHENPEGVEYCEDCGASLTMAAPSASAVTGQGQDSGPESAATPTEPAADVTGGGAAPATPLPTPPVTALGSITGQNARLVTRRYGADAGEEYPLLGDRLVVGRFDPETGPVDIDLSRIPEAPQLSRHHAELYREADGRWHVKDLGSTNGVFIKSAGSATFGPRLTSPQPLASGDEVAFGNARFSFRMD